MKGVAILLLAVIGLVLVIGGLGAVAEDTYPDVVRISQPHTHPGGTGAQEGNPLLLVAVVVILGVGFIAGVKS